MDTIVLFPSLLSFTLELPTLSCFHIDAICFRSGLSSSPASPLRDSINYLILLPVVLVSLLPASYPSPTMAFKCSLIFLSSIILHHSLCVAHLFLQAPIRDRSEKLKFGQATCISSDGRRVAIGANGYDRFRGALYVYDLASGSGERMEHWRRTRVVGNDTISAEEKEPRELRVIERGSGFGFSCAITPDGENLVIGAPGHSLQRGALYLFSYAQKSASWNERGKLEAPGLKSADLFGWAVVVSELCDTIAVSAKGRRANNGEVFLYSCKAGCLDCKLSERLAPSAYTDSAGPRGIRIRNNFGVSVAMNQKGNVLAVGCIGYKEESGAVYVYTRNESKNWNEIQRIESPNAQKFGFFGYKVSMDNEGKTVAIGADGEKQYTGAVYMFSRQAGSSCTDKFEYMQTMTRDELNTEDNFGGAVALSGDGKALLVGAPGKSMKGLKDHGVTYLFEDTTGCEEGNWKVTERVELPSAHSKEESMFGWSVEFSSKGGRFVATAPNSYNGEGLVALGKLGSRSKGSDCSKRRKERQSGDKDEL